MNARHALCPELHCQCALTNQLFILRWPCYVAKLAWSFLASCCSLSNSWGFRPDWPCHEVLTQSQASLNSQWAYSCWVHGTHTYTLLYSIHLKCFLPAFYNILPTVVPVIWDVSYTYCGYMLKLIWYYWFKHFLLFTSWVSSMWIQYYSRHSSHEK